MGWKPLLVAVFTPFSSPQSVSRKKAANNGKGIGLLTGNPIQNCKQRGKKSGGGGGEGCGVE